MQDDLSIKPVVAANISGDDLGSTLTFVRVQSTNNRDSLRQNSAIHSLSPTQLRIAHQPISIKNPVQRSLVAVDQVLTRFDAQSNPIGQDKHKFAVQSDRTATTSLAEYRASAMLLFGQMLENNGAGIDAMYYGQT